jgi:hypothetical protein
MGTNHLFVRLRRAFLFRDVGSKGAFLFSVGGDKLKNIRTDRRLVHEVSML